MDLHEGRLIGDLCVVGGYAQYATARRAFSSLFQVYDMKDVDEHRGKLMISG